MPASPIDSDCFIGFQELDRKAGISASKEMKAIIKAYVSVVSNVRQKETIPNAIHGPGLFALLTTLRKACSVSSAKPAPRILPVALAHNTASCA